MSEPYSIGPFILGRTLGEGATGRVKLGFHKDNGFKVAIKIIKKSALIAKPNTLKKVQREIAVLKLLDHPNVVKLYDVYETDEYLFLITEYVDGGELFEYIIQHGVLEHDEALRFFQMLVHGMDYVHSHHLVHRDLKPENLLLDDKKNLKIADFGMAAVIEPGTFLETSCGSPHYASPEVVSGKRYDGTKSDTWSIGVILFALTSGRLPFDDENIRVLLSKVKSGLFRMPPFIPRDAQDLITKILVVDPLKRMTLKQVKEHPYFTKNNIETYFQPIPVFEPSKAILNELDEDIVSTLESLYMCENGLIREELHEIGPNYKKAFYTRLLQEKLFSEREDRYDKIIALHRGLPVLPGVKRTTRARSYSTAVAVNTEAKIIPLPSPPPSPSPSPHPSPCNSPIPLSHKEGKPVKIPLSSKGKSRELHHHRKEETPTIPTNSSEGDVIPTFQTSGKTSRKMVRSRRASVVISNMAPETPQKKEEINIEESKVKNRARRTSNSSKFVVNLNPENVTEKETEVEKPVPKKTFWSSFFKNLSKKKPKKTREKDIEEEPPKTRERSSSGSRRKEKDEEKKKPSVKEVTVLNVGAPEGEIAPGLTTSFLATLPQEKLMEKIEGVLKLIGVRVNDAARTCLQCTYASIEGTNKVDFSIQFTHMADEKIKFEFVKSVGNDEQFRDMLKAVFFELS